MQSKSEFNIDPFALIGLVKFSGTNLKTRQALFVSIFKNQLAVPEMEVAVLLGIFLVQIPGIVCKTRRACVYTVKTTVCGDKYSTRQRRWSPLCVIPVIFLGISRFSPDSLSVTQKRVEDCLPCSAHAKN